MLMTSRSEHDILSITERIFSVPRNHCYRLQGLINFKTYRQYRIKKNKEVVPQRTEVAISGRPPKLSAVCNLP